VDWHQLADEARDVLPNWLGGPPAALTPVEGGTLNWNFRVSTTTGAYLLRCHRDNLESERIEGEHSLLAWAGARGIPAPVPIASRDGRTLIEVGARRWSFARWLPGRQLPRASLSSVQVRALGSAHGHLQALLATHPESHGATLSMRWDPARSLDALTRLADLARDRGEPGWLIDGITHQRDLFARVPVQPPEVFTSLPCQLLHGDFHDQQVLFDGDRVSAILDWEIWHVDPRAWELVRSLSFSKLLDSLLLDDYLAGYRQYVRLEADEATLALQLWFQSRLETTWAWHACLVDGNDRVRAFFPDMLAELDRVTDPAWTAAITTRFVGAACG
jgi:homoserine kinase type II